MDETARLILVLHARSHRLHSVLALMLSTFIGMYFVRSTYVIGFERWAYELPYPAVVFGPLIMAGAVAALLYEPFGELEVSLSDTAWKFRTALIVGGLAVGLVLIMLSFGAGSSDWWAVGWRNFLAFTGAASFSAMLLDARLAWMPLTVAILASYTASATTSLEGAKAPDVLWQWPVLPASMDLSLAVAGLFALGIPIVCIMGPRTRASL